MLRGVAVVFACSGFVDCDSQLQEKLSSSHALELAQAQCDYIARCDPDALHMFAGSSEEGCIDNFLCGAERGLPRWRWPNAAEADLRSCVDSLRERPCPDMRDAPLDRFSYAGLFPFGSACGEPELETLLAPAPDAPRAGQPCVRVFSERHACQGDSYCAVGDGARIGSARCGTCEPYVEIGEACDSTVRCVPGARCVLWRCTEILPVGAACTVPEQCRFKVCDDGRCGLSEYAPEPYEEVLGRECEGIGNCGNQAGLKCEDGRCRPLPDEGEACTGSCRRGQMCIDGQCTGFACTVGLGDRCEFACTEGDCIDGVCQPLGDQVGSRCHLFCAGGLRCVNFECELVPDRSDGASCDFDSDCDSGFCSRDISAYCDDRSCSIPRCDGCGKCSAPPTAMSCVGL